MLGMDLRALLDLQSVDELSRVFTPSGILLGYKLSETDTVKGHQETIAGCDLVSDVPDGTRAAFERARLAHVYGALEYEFFTIADSQAHLVLEVALRECFELWADGDITVQKGSHPPETIPVTTYADVEKAFRRGGTHQGSSLVTESGPIPFTGGLRSLIAWARLIGLLRGQRNRITESTLIALRNYTAHEKGKFRIGPNESARTIGSLAEIINRLYDHPTVGGRHYPPLRHRQPMFFASSGDGSLATVRPDQLTMSRDLDGWRFVCFMVADEEPGPTWCDSWYDLTRFPSTYLWGPGDLDEAIAWASLSCPEEDLVDHLDRLFVIPARSAPRLWAWRPEVLATLPHDRQAGMWRLVQADSPSDAVELVRWLHQRDPNTPEEFTPDQKAVDHGSYTWPGIVAELKDRGCDLGAAGAAPPRVKVDPFNNLP
jgi:hypothetical protein